MAVLVTKWPEIHLHQVRVQHDSRKIQSTTFRILNNRYKNIVLPDLMNDSSSVSDVTSGPSLILINIFSKSYNFTNEILFRKIVHIKLFL
jgi:hypothetical protein